MLTVFIDFLLRRKNSLVGLGYVGMPIAGSFAKKVKGVGFDPNAKKLNFTSRVFTLKQCLTLQE